MQRWQRIFAGALLGLVQGIGAASMDVTPQWIATTPPSPAETTQATTHAGGLLQFTAGGHVLGFETGGMYVAAPSHSLRVDFVGANAVAPVADGSGTPSPGGKAPALDEVRYPNLWPGIDLAYTAGHGIAESTYTLAPGADPASIELRYNVPMEVQADGSLRLVFETGILSESAPVAWQEIGGERRAVAVAFDARSGSKRLGFRVGSYDSARPLIIDPVVSWNTFLGGAEASDWGASIAVDGGGNLYVLGASAASWGSPLRAFTGAGEADMVVAKLASDGTPLWHTFIGGAGEDYGKGIALDGDGNIYVTGQSTATWGNPKQAFSGEQDILVAKLDSAGTLLWHTFLGGSGKDYGEDIAIDGSGNAYITGYSDDPWDPPTRANPTVGAIVVAKLAANGELLWHTFLGTRNDKGEGIALDASGNPYVVGTSYTTWGNPLQSFSGLGDIVVAKLSTTGVLQWHTFLGGGGGEWGNAIALDGSGNIFVTGLSEDWGAPLRPYAGITDIVVAKLANNGALQWHTFLGGTDSDQGYGIAVDRTGTIYAIGYSNRTWGDPLQPFPSNGHQYAVIVKLSASGSLEWNTSLGYVRSYDKGIAVDGGGIPFVVGTSNTNREVYEAQDIYVARLNPGATSAGSQLGNISTRAMVQTGDDVLIAGFIIDGTQSKTVVVRAIGPSMAALGVNGVLADPTLELYSGSSVIASNDDWGDSPDQATIAALGLAPDNGLESALLASLAPGPYTAVVRGLNDTVGVGQVAVDDTTPGSGGRLFNISGRSLVKTGDQVQIAGLIITGSEPQSVLIRGLGPSLAGFGVAGALSDPVLEVYSGSTLIASNDDWGSASNSAAVAAMVQAPTDAKEAALLLTLDPGAYTAILRGYLGATGVGLVSVDVAE